METVRGSGIEISHWVYTLYT